MARTKGWPARLNSPPPPRWSWRSQPATTPAMQALTTVQKPFAAPAAAARSSGRRALAVRAAAEPEQLSRRALAGFLAAAPVLLPASRALALIPDDDDEELVEKARANRAKRLAAERETQQAFSRSAKGLGEAT